MQDEYILMRRAEEEWERPMKLTLFTDYSMRVLLYLGARPDRLCSIGEVAQAYGISQNHLMKVVNQLARSGDVESVRGRSGGIRLGGRPKRSTSAHSYARPRTASISLTAADAWSRLHGLTGVLKEALGAFTAV
jgi:Rrf2 family nitric oxide-sensitive transcriptional repressor